MLADVIVEVRQKTDVAAARRAALELAAFADSDGADMGALSLVVTEAATNLIKHAGGGHIVLRRMAGARHAWIEMIAMDKGPGLTNPARSFEDGYSTAGSPGTGLGAVARLSSFCDYYSAPQKGFVLMARVGAGPENGRNGHNVEYGVIGAAYPGEDVSGDGWAVSVRNQSCRVIVADGLGHGLLAAEASDAALETANSSPDLKPEDVLEKCHMRLRSTRGAAVSIADADFGLGKLAFAGVGNVAGAIVTDSEQRRQMLSINGTVGHEMRKAHPYQYPLPAGALVVMHSDGLSTNWGLEKYPGLFYRHPSVVAGVLFRDFRRDRDDATVIVARAK